MLLRRILEAELDAMGAEADVRRAPCASEGTRPAPDFPAGGCWSAAGDPRSSDARIPSDSGTVQPTILPDAHAVGDPGQPRRAAQRTVELQAQPHDRSSGIADRVALERRYLAA